MGEDRGNGKRGENIVFHGVRNQYDTMKRFLSIAVRVCIYVIIWTMSSVHVTGAPFTTNVSIKPPTPIETQGYGNEHENIFTLRYGWLWQQDQYLSPLLYSGQQVGLSNEWWQGFRKGRRQLRYANVSRYTHSIKNDFYSGTWKHVGRLHADFGWTYNPNYSNLIYSLGISSGWGACYTWKWRNRGIELLLGPYADLDWKSKLHSANVNKPYSIDLAVNLCALGGVSWTFEANKMTFRLRYLAQMNLIGAEYIPDYWQSYYEMTEGVLGKIRPAGVWNHRHLKHELTFDMQLRHTTWRIGFAHTYLEYGMQNLRFSDEEASVILGCIWNYRVNKAKSMLVW